MSAEPAPSLARHALLPASLVLCFWLVYGARVSPAWGLAVAGPMVALYLAAPALGRAAVARFDRAALRRLAGGDGAALRPLYARAWSMRLLAPPALALERRGLAEASAGRPAQARAAYRGAHELYPEGAAPVAVELGLAHASYALGDDRAAIVHYRRVLRQTGDLPRVAQNLAHALARRSEDLDEAAVLVQRAVDDAGEDPPPGLRLVQARVLAARGRRGPARKILRSTRDAEGVDALREEVLTALEVV